MESTWNMRYGTALHKSREEIVLQAESDSYDWWREWNIRGQEGDETRWPVVQSAHQHWCFERWSEGKKFGHLLEWFAKLEVLLFATSLEQVEKMVCHFKQSIEKVGQKIHPGKTKILSYQSSKKRTEVSIDNVKVEILYCPRKKAQNIMDKQLNFSNKR